jgi:hypothetical protein
MMQLHKAFLVATTSLLVLAVSVQAQAEVATYRLTIDNTWSEATHPGNVPQYAHFSWLGGGTHTDAVSFWDVGVATSPGMTQMAENGRTTILATEISAAITAGTAGSVLSWQHWFCPAGETYLSCGVLIVEFDIDDAFPLVTLVSMLGPSPDWFIGVSGLRLHDGDDWVYNHVVDLHPFDGGTRSNNLFELGGPLTTPPDPVSLITIASGQLIGPGSLGTFTFQRLGVPPPPPPPAALPSLDWRGMVVLGLLIALAAALRMRARPATAVH